MITTTIDKDGTMVVEYEGKTYTQSEWDAYYAANKVAIDDACSLPSIPLQ